MTKVYHTFPVYYNGNSEILILGSMPSVKSRELGFTTCIHKIDFG